MVRNAFEILKIRWPEVLLIVVLQAALMIFMDELTVMSESMTDTQQMPLWAGFIMGVGSILYAVVWTMLYLGFLKTAATGGAYPQEPMNLVRVGRAYFWKIIWFQVLFGLFLWILTGALFAVLGWLIWRTDDITKIPDWFAQACGLGALLMLIKPLLFVPARILVYDETALQAVPGVRPYRIGNVEGLWNLLAGGVLVIAGLTVLSGLAPRPSAVYYILSGVHHLVFSLVFLTLTLTAVLRVQQDYHNQRGTGKGPMQA